MLVLSAANPGVAATKPRFKRKNSSARPKPNPGPSPSKSEAEGTLRTDQPSAEVHTAETVHVHRLGESLSSPVEHGSQRLALWAKWVHGQGAVLESIDRAAQ